MADLKHIYVNHAVTPATATFSIAQPAVGPIALARLQMVLGHFSPALNNGTTIQAANGLPPSTIQIIAAPNIGATTFHQFPLLPIEVRKIICLFADADASKAQIVRLATTGRGGSRRGRKFWRIFTRGPPDLVNVSHECRLFVIEKYKVLDTLEFPGPIFFQPAHDTIVVDTFMALFTLARSMPRFLPRTTLISRVPGGLRHLPIPAALTGTLNVQTIRFMAIDFVAWDAGNTDKEEAFLSLTGLEEIGIITPPVADNVRRERKKAAFDLETALQKRGEKSVWTKAGWKVPKVISCTMVEWKARRA